DFKSDASADSATPAMCLTITAWQTGDKGRPGVPLCSGAGARRTTCRFGWLAFATMPDGWLPDGRSGLFRILFRLASLGLFFQGLENSLLDGCFRSPGLRHHLADGPDHGLRLVELDEVPAVGDGAVSAVRGEVRLVVVQLHALLH